MTKIEKIHAAMDEMEAAPTWEKPRVAKKILLLVTWQLQELENRLKALEGGENG